MVVAVSHDEGDETALKPVSVGVRNDGEVPQCEEGKAMESDDYEVGFGRPPKQTKFRKGSSGNPQGRPKGSRNLATVVARALEAQVTVTENGRCRTVTALDAAISTLVSKAVDGDLGALRQLIGLAGSKEVEEDSAKKQLTEIDLLVVRNFLKRLAGCAKGESDEI
jgi:hypothetical protein